MLFIFTMRLYVTFGLHFFRRAFVTGRSKALANLDSTTVHCQFLANNKPFIDATPPPYNFIATHQPFYNNPSNNNMVSSSQPPTVPLQ